MDKPKKLILDYSKWICGEGGEHQLGKGTVALKNDQGFYCCLGMWSVQCGATEEEILNFGEPSDIDTLIPLFADDESWEYDTINDETGKRETVRVSHGKRTTPLAVEAIDINDAMETTPEEKIVALSHLLAKEGIELEVINKP